ncbi:MAG TPA: DEAD/DEAH box helicase [Thermoguttaceae bacterium]|nr:DEAD/DEAH box helicase [Thermoguttaceae bacterium]
MQFDTLGLLEPMLRAVQAAGYERATPIQVQTIPRIIEGRDLIGCAQTGTGKTAAFALPTLQRLRGDAAPQTDAAPPANARLSTDARSSKPWDKRNRAKNGRAIRALILSPTRELAVQIAASFAEYGRFTDLRHTVVYGGVSQNSQVRALQRGVDILVATPGRVLDLMTQGFVDVTGVEILIFDEADRMLDMGFIHDLRRIAAKVPSRRQTLMFSATMPEAIRRVAAEWLRDPVHIQVAAPAAPADKIEQSVYFVEPKQKPMLLTDFLNDKPGTRTLVFSRTKHGADKIVRNLLRGGIQAAAIHGNKSQATRQRVLDQFKSDRLPVLVATDVAARGLDVDGIAHVINYDMPLDPETYVHRIGRTGRAGASGIAVSFCGRDEQAQLRLIERLIRRSIAIEGGTPQPESPRPARSSQPPRPKQASRPKHASRSKQSFRSKQASHSKSGAHSKPGGMPIRSAAEVGHVVSPSSEPHLPTGKPATAAKRPYPVGRKPRRQRARSRTRRAV